MNGNGNTSKRVYVAGHNGLVGSAIVRALKRRGYTNIITRPRARLDLTEQAQVRAFFQAESIDEIYLAAATVGGIHANNIYPAQFIYSNLVIQSNVIHEAWRHGIKQLLFLGSSCIYPRLAGQPITEQALLSGPLEPTNEPYAIAKIAGIKCCESYNRQYGTNFRSVMPTNLYGPGDYYHPENSHVIPALIQRLHHAKTTGESEVAIWGSGKALREFLYVDDLADACLHVMGLSSAAYRSATSETMSHLNVGSGSDVSIAQLAGMIAEVVGYQGRLVYDTSKPDGTPRKLLESSALRRLGWSPQVTLEQGLREAYHSYRRAGNDGDRHAPARGLDPLSMQCRRAFMRDSAHYHAYQDMRAPS
ncbi:GDP-L-fucose synthase family protein [Pseudoduganella namucuonensis]|uniref:GDP-L-fucose synthase n=1 Tax=Pseudoduganella namucuonensis TaxID=1035707 RepID=A0A1I7K2V4_9BURK|nr:GDP-L-fucose synthase [Pseudoduganella namucuonensis]SFU91757.1 GDP-L-fucose synthase [Pseudoduganella namucuonensis]